MQQADVAGKVPKELAIEAAHKSAHTRGSVKKAYWEGLSSVGHRKP